MGKAELLKELGFSDEFIKIVEKEDDPTIRNTGVNEVKIVDPLQFCGTLDLTELKIQKTDPPVSPIISTITR